MKYPLWKPILIVFVLVLFALLIWQRGLKPGLDLVGGTTLVYDVKVAPDADASQVIDETISVLRQRVDPAGVRNLSWRQVAGNRIEIQMALAPPETARLRDDFVAAQEALVDANISEVALDAALRAEPGERLQALRNLAGDSQQLKERLEALYEAQQILDQARGPYQQAAEALENAQKTLDALDDTAGQAVVEAAKARVDDLETQLASSVAAYYQKKQAYEQAKAQVLAGNLSNEEMQRIYDASSAVPADGTLSPRQQIVDRLIQEHPHLEKLISNLVDAYTAYEKVKGPLDDPNDLIAMLRGSGVLEFRIAAFADAPGLDVQAYYQQLAERGPRAGADQPWRWMLIDDIEEFVDWPTNKREAEAQRQLFENDVRQFFIQTQGLIGDEYDGDYYVLLANTPDRSITQAQEGWELSQVNPTRDEMGYAAIAFRLNPVGGQLMGKITGPNQGRPMAIVLDGRIISSPRLNSQIFDSGIITGGRGGFGPRELSYLLRTLRAGSLDAQLSDYPISIKTTGPRLGQDNLKAGLHAAVYSLIAVAVFMALYYLFAGMVANFALAVNMLMILGVMSLIEATFTLPGIAGVVLTIGMAVDANVLIFERIREELERKVDLLTAVRLGYQKAFSTIIDANLTTLITCVVLGYTATAEIKGFAVTLGIGIITTLFSVLFASRVVVDLYLMLLKPKMLPMLPTLIPTVRKVLSPSVDWVGKWPIFFLLSGALQVVGISMIVIRGADMLDIEFRSGTQVSFQLAQGQSLPISEVRERLEGFAQLGRAMVDGDGNLVALRQQYPDAAEALPQILEASKERYDTAMEEYERALQAGLDAEEPDPMMDPKLLDGAQVVTLGTVEDGQATGFTVSTLIVDSRAVSDVVKAAFADVLDKTPVVAFDGDEADRVALAPVRAVVRSDAGTRADLGQLLGRPQLTEDVTSFLGGVVVELNDLSPAITITEMEKRLSRMRMQPAYEDLGGRNRQVVGLEQAGRDSDGNPTWSAIAVVSRDDATNYQESPEIFMQRGGLADTEWNLVRDALQRGDSLDSVSNFNSQVSGTMKQQAIVAMVLSLLAVVAYIWLRFGSFRYGVAAIVALTHDVTMALGIVALSQWLYDNSIGHFFLLDPFKIDLALVAACLTIVGYSLNDTIVVFDRIRENRGRLAAATKAIINDSINQTISRTVLTSSTTLLAVVVLYTSGGPGVHGFAFAMIIGVFVGTYSSIAIAAPMLWMLSKLTGNQVGDRSKTQVAPGPATA